MRTKQAHLFNKKGFAKRLKVFRDQLGMTQEEFGDAINRTRTAFHVIESGKVSPSLDLIQGIYNLLHRKGFKVSMDYLFCLSDIQSDNEAIKEIQVKFDKKETEYVKEINGLQKQLLGKK